MGEGIQGMEIPLHLYWCHHDSDNLVTWASRLYWLRLVAVVWPYRNADPGESGISKGVLVNSLLSVYCRTGIMIILKSANINRNFEIVKVRLFADAATVSTYWWWPCDLKCFPPLGFNGLWKFYIACICCLITYERIDDNYGWLMFGLYFRGQLKEFFELTTCIWDFNFLSVRIISA